MFAFLVCTKWYNPAIHRHAHYGESCSSSVTIRYLDWNRGFVVSSEEDHEESGICSLQDIGGHIMKIPLITFQILLFMRLEVSSVFEKHYYFDNFGMFSTCHLLKHMYLSGNTIQC